MAILNVKGETVLNPNLNRKQGYSTLPTSSKRNFYVYSVLARYHGPRTRSNPEMTLHNWALVSRNLDSSISDSSDHLRADATGIFFVVIWFERGEKCSCRLYDWYEGDAPDHGQQKRVFSRRLHGKELSRKDQVRLRAYRRPSAYVVEEGLYPAFQLRRKRKISQFMSTVFLLLKNNNWHFYHSSFGTWWVDLCGCSTQLRVSWRQFEYY